MEESKMKRLIGLVGILLILSICFVSAGSIEDLNYNDKHDNSWWGQTDENRQVDDYNVNIDADTVEGVDIVGYIGNNEAAWLTDTASITNNGGSGLDREELSDYLTGFTNVFSVYSNFVEYLKTKFVTRAELEQANQRMDYLEARINLPNGTEDQLYAEQIRIGKVRRGDIKCDGAFCLEVSIVG
jgi:hypothetical protein